MLSDVLVVISGVKAASRIMFGIDAGVAEVIRRSSPTRTMGTCSKGRSYPNEKCYWQVLGPYAGEINIFVTKAASGLHQVRVSTIPRMWKMVSITHPQWGHARVSARPM